MKESNWIAVWLQIVSAEFSYDWQGASRCVAFTTHESGTLHYTHKAIMCFGSQLWKKRANCSHQGMGGGVVHAVAGGLCCDKPHPTLVKRPVCFFFFCFFWAAGSQQVSIDAQRATLEMKSAFEAPLMKPHSWLIQRRSTLASPPKGEGGRKNRRAGEGKEWGGEGLSKAGRSGAGDDELGGNLFSLCLYLACSVDVMVRVYIQKHLMRRAAWQGEGLGGTLVFILDSRLCFSQSPRPELSQLPLLKRDLSRQGNAVDVKTATLLCFTEEWRQQLTWVNRYLENRAY